MDKEATRKDIMPQLKISDVKYQLDEFEKSVNKRFTELTETVTLQLEEIQKLIPESGGSCKCSGSTDGVEVSDVAPVNTSIVENVEKTLRKEIETLRSDVGGHVKLYNNHIVQQHSPSK